MTEILLQIVIVVSGCLAIWLLSTNKPWSRWGYIVGLLGQPAWLWSNAMHAQWGMFAVSIFFTYAYANGIWNHYIKPARSK